MISRRELLLQAAAFLATASQPRTPINFDVPPGACDCHTHLFGDPKRFPMTPSRVYTPEPALVDEMRTLHRALHMDRVVIVQPSIYGTDNACTLDAVKQLGSRARAIAVIDVQTPGSDTMLADMDAAGVRGIRLNLETSGIADPSVGSQRVRAAIDRLRGSRWHIQMNTRLSMIDAIRAQVAGAPVRFVFDHFGGAQATLGMDQPGFKSLAGPRARRIGVREDFWRVSQLDAGAELPGRDAVRQGARGREPAARSLGHRLAAPRLRHRRRPRRTPTSRRCCRLTMGRC